MVTSPLYDGSGGLPCLDFVNSVDRTVDKPWVDRVRSYADLLAWSVAARTLSRDRSADLARDAERRPQEAARTLERARTVREALYRILAARVEGTAPTPADLALLNHELAQSLVRSRLEPAGGGFTWGWQADEDALASPLWPVMRSAAELLTSPELALVKRCASESCLWLFLDRTKNHARRWCDMKVCGNRTKVRRHRSGARRSESARRDPEERPAGRARIGRDD